MRAPRLYVVLGLITIYILGTVAFAQTSKAQPKTEANGSQAENSKPANPAGNTGIGIAPPSANNPGQAASGDKQHQGQLGGQKWTPPADDLASPSAITLSVPDSPATVPQYVLFESLFSNISLLNEIADHDDKAGKHTAAASWRTHDKRGAGLNDAEGQILQETAIDCLRALKEQDKKINSFADAFRAQAPPGAAIQAPPELLQMVEDRKAIVKDHVERLRQSLGDTTFSKLDDYVRASFHGEVIAPKAKSPSLPMVEKAKESR
jgi:hypothetical protein